MSVQDTARVRELQFRGINPYESFVAHLADADLQGWNSDHPVLPHLIRQLRLPRIIEVGTWKGRSAIKMALASKVIGLHTEIICVDTFLGSAEHWLASGITKPVMQFCNEVSVFPISELSKAVTTRNPNVGLRNRIVQL